MAVTEDVIQALPPLPHPSIIATLIAQTDSNYQRFPDYILSCALTRDM